LNHQLISQKGAGCRQARVRLWISTVTQSTDSTKCSSNTSLANSPPETPPASPEQKKGAEYRMFPVLVNLFLDLAKLRSGQWAIVDFVLRQQFDWQLARRLIVGLDFPSTSTGRTVQSSMGR
jgi:hypothetical protein